MLKFQRNYYAEFVISEKQNNTFVEKEVLTVSYPIALNLQINLGACGQANSGTFQFYNLSQADQAKLWRDVYNNGSKQIKIRLYAGYNNTMPLVFYGWVQSCISYRNSGSVDTVTEIQAFEGGRLFQYGFVNTTFTAYTQLADVINFMLESDPDTKLGCISPELPELTRNKTFIGQTMDLLGREYGGYEIFIEKGKLHILGDNDVVQGELLVITDETGLLGSPRRSNAFLEVDMIFEPQLRVGQAISLLSDTMPQFNQAYKVVNIKHYGTISARTCGTLKTTLTLTVLDGVPRQLEEVRPTTYESKNVSTTWDKPVKGGKITSPFGFRTAPIKGASTFHNGIDIGIALNTPIYAPANGKVAFTAQGDGYGNYIQINNGTINGKIVSSLYGHLNAWNVQQGDVVYKGQTIIGYVGSTGISTGPHLHFEVREDGAPVDPTKYIGVF